MLKDSLKACQSLLNEYLPKLKALPKAQITRQVCGGCLDFKVSITQPLEEHGAWAEANYEPLESEFMDKLKKIEGTSLHEVQESELITFLCFRFVCARQASLMRSLFFSSSTTLLPYSHI